MTAMSAAPLPHRPHAQAPANLHDGLPSGPPSSLPVGAVPHLLLPFASASDDAAQALLPQLKLPNLARLLALRPSQHPEADTPADGDLSLTPPHERAHAALLGLTSPDGQVPWAAWRTQCAGPAAWFTPCHQEVGNGQVTLQNPDELNLSEAHSRALLAALQPWALEDGLTLSWHSPTQWLAQGATLAGLATASLDRVVGRSLAPWLPMGAAAAPLRRLQNEAQMLFYTQPAHDERVAQHLPPVNAFWISGSGICPTTARASAPELVVAHTLKQPALSGDWRAWQQAWQMLDTQVLPQWLAHAQAGGAMRLTLCGERTDITLGWTPQTAWQQVQNKISSFLRPYRLTDVLYKL